MNFLQVILPGGYPRRPRVLKESYPRISQNFESHNLSEPPAPGTRIMWARGIRWLWWYNMIPALTSSQIWDIWPRVQVSKVGPGHGLRWAKFSPQLKGLPYFGTAWRLRRFYSDYAAITVVPYYGLRVPSRWPAASTARTWRWPYGSRCRRPGQPEPEYMPVPCQGSRS